MPKSEKQKGFTLIELLIVFAIIILLATISLVPLTNARNKAKDGEVKTSLSQVRVIASKIQSDLSNFTVLCNTADHTLCNSTGGSCSGNNYTAELKTLEDDMVLHYPGNTVACYSNTNAFCVSFSLHLGGYACVDAKGVLKNTTNPCAMAGNCP